MRLALTSSHVDPAALELAAGSDPNVYTSGSGGIWTETNDKGFYRFEHLPLGSYNVTASKGEGGNFHEFEKPIQATELTLDAPNQLAVDFVDISVYPISGKITYSIKKNDAHVFVENVEITAQPVSTAGATEALPSTKPATGAQTTNYSLPLFAGQYLFLAKREGHDIRIDENSPGYDSTTQLVTIRKAETSIDFIDYTERTITVYVEDSGGFPITHYPEYLDPDQNPISVSVSGDNGQASGDTAMQDAVSIFTAVVPPGKYTVEISGAKPEKKEVDVVGGDRSVTMTIPVPIELQVGPAPRLFQDRFLEELGFADSSDNPEGYMFYFPPELQAHAYEIRATANGNPVGNFTLKVTDNISQLDASPASQETYPDPASDRFEPIEDPATGEYIAAKYTITAGLPNYTEVEESDPDTYVEDTLADGTVVRVPKVLPKGISFQASKDGYADSDIYELNVTVLGDVAEGTAPEIVAVPNVNYLVLHDPPGDGSYSYLNDSMKIRGMLIGVTMKVKDTEIPVYPSPWSVERNMLNFTFNEAGDSGIAEFLDMEGKGIIGYRNSTPTIAGFAFAAVVEGVSGALLAAAPGPLSYALQLLKVGLTPAVIAAGDMVQYEVSPNRRLQTSAGDTLPDLMGPGKGDIYYGEGWTVGLMTKYRLSIGKDPDTGEWVPVTKQIMAYDILDRHNQYVYNVRDIERIIENLDSQIMALGDPADDTPEKAEKDRLTGARETWSGLLKKNPAYIWEKNNIKGGEESDRNREALDDFLLADGYEDGEMLIFSGGGSSFEYSRSISEANMANYSTSIGVGTEGHMSNEQEVSVGFEAFGSGTTLKFKIGASASISTNQGFGRNWESGTQSEQTVGFVLADDDIGDNISTYVYEGPWGTPVFFTDPGSVTSDPWQD